ncbi:MAG: hypothetical protein WC760_08360 [Bacteroidia bacterium]|jgi:hypothetical protein
MSENQKDVFKKDHTEEPSIKKTSEHNNSQPIPGNPDEIKHIPKTEVPVISDKNKDDVNDKMEDTSITKHDKTSGNHTDKAPSEDAANSEDNERNNM